jgi:hypothetical protein
MAERPRKRRAAGTERPQHCAGASRPTKLSKRMAGRPPDGSSHGLERRIGGRREVDVERTASYRAQPLDKLGDA